MAKLKDDEEERLCLDPRCKLPATHDGPCEPEDEDGPGGREDEAICPDCGVLIDDEGGCGCEIEDEIEDEIGG